MELGIKIAALKSHVTFGSRKSRKMVIGNIGGEMKILPVGPIIRLPLRSPDPSVG
jgi:hypothetical protein